MVDFKKMNNGRATHVYCDGGCVGRNPSEEGGTWAYRLVWQDGDAEDVVVAEESGLVLAPPGRPVTNNHTEQIAIVKALEALPDGWSGTVCSDSQIALGRVFKGWREKNLPRNVADRTRATVARMGTIKTVLLQGHPTQADLLSGIGKKRGLPVSIHNKWCDEACSEESKRFRDIKAKAGIDENMVKIGLGIALPENEVMVVGRDIEETVCIEEEAAGLAQDIEAEFGKREIS